MRKYFKIFTCGVQDASAYRGNLIVGVLSNFIITAVMFYIWKVIYETNVIIDNYNWEDMKIYLFISFICNSTLSWSAETKISKKIITGELTSDLIKPMGFMSMTFFETAGAGVPVSMISILIMSIVAIFMKIQMPTNPIVYFMFIISLVFSFVINFFISFICALLCFWTENYFGITKSKQVIVNFFSGADYDARSTSKNCVCITVSGDCLYSFFHIYGKHCWERCNVPYFKSNCMVHSSIYRTSDFMALCN